MGDQESGVEDLERILSDVNAEPIKIPYAVIKSVTKNFAQVIGDGGFGVVYLGDLGRGMVAVKKLSISESFTDKQFLDEVACLKRVKHKNIVKYIGYCADTQGYLMEVDGEERIVEVPQRLLCFEYVPNGSLHHYLQENIDGYEWSIRYKIIKGICQGLHYLHQSRINHLDLKPANVLLGAHMEPKITDFGLSRCIDENQSTIFTTNLCGTPGYIAPEFIDKQKISFKSDIFSLGIIMTRLLIGSNESIAENWHESLHVECQQMKICIEIAQICAEYDPAKRPTIADIILKLNKTETMVQKVPPDVNEPRNDPKSSLHQVVKRFRALPTQTLHEYSSGRWCGQIAADRGSTEGGRRPSLAGRCRLVLGSWPLLAPARVLPTQGHHEARQVAGVVVDSSCPCSQGGAHPMTTLDLLGLANAILGLDIEPAVCVQRTILGFRVKIIDGLGPRISSAWRMPSQ
uniref:non-specific serine/threonine protein kinase n=1 Tax=Setaria italica TaxID=4555 RepID=K3ZIE1_SETIT